MRYLKIVKRINGRQAHLTVPKEILRHYDEQGIDLMMPSIDEENRLVYTPIITPKVVNKNE